MITALLLLASNSWFIICLDDMNTGWYVMTRQVNTTCNLVLMQKELEYVEKRPVFKLLPVWCFFNEIMLCLPLLLSYQQIMIDRIICIDVTWPMKHYNRHVLERLQYLSSLVMLDPYSICTHTLTTIILFIHNFDVRAFRTSTLCFSLR